MGQKEPPRLGSTICYGRTWIRKSHQDSAVRQMWPPRLGSTICYGEELTGKCLQDSAVRFVATKREPERATETRQYDLLRPRIGQKEPSRLCCTICYGQTCARKSHQDSAIYLLWLNVGQEEPPRFDSMICNDQIWIRKSFHDSAVRFVTAKSWPERITKTRQYDLLRPNVGQKQPARLDTTICYGEELALSTR